MSEKDPDNSPAEGQIPQDAHGAPKSKSTRGLLLIFLVFFAFVTVVFLTQRKDTIDWVEDYETGLKLAREQNKPVLLAFYKEFAPHTTPTFENTYTDRAVINYVETNLVPILIDVDKHPEIAKRYEVGYYPSHYVKYPDSTEKFGPMVGYDPPALFIKKLKSLMERMQSSGK
jgi:thioredoxin-related protein